MSSLFNFLQSFDAGTKNLLWGVIGLTILAILGGLSITSYTTPPSEETSQPYVPEVTLQSVRELGNSQSSLVLTGIVESRTEATLLAEAQGRIAKVHNELGDFVTAGSIIAEIENARERAAVHQAQGALDSAQASFDKVRKGAREEQISILSISAQSAREALLNAKDAAVNTLLSAYATLDDAVNKKTDTNFQNPTSENSIFLVSTSASHAADEARNLRRELQKILEANALVARSLSTDTDLAKELEHTETSLRLARTYLDVVIDALSHGIATESFTALTIATNKAEAVAARAAITGMLTALGGSRGAIQGREAQLQIAEKNLEQGLEGNQPEDVKVAAGSVTAAEGALAAQNAALEKTFVRAPFSGTLNMLDAKLGEYAAFGKVLATIANNDALEIVTAITEHERNSLTVGAPVLVEGVYQAMITKIAPALDPRTKKIEVRGAFVQNPHGLSNGETVRIEFKPISVETDTILIPIETLKITPDGSVVFTVSPDGHLIAHTVTEGAIRGDHIEIIDGLTKDTVVVVDARGLKEREVVRIKN